MLPPQCQPTLGRPAHLSTTRPPLHSHRSRPSDSESEGEDEDDFLDMDPFGLDDDGTCCPVVELSTDLPGELTQDDILDALEFCKQHQTLSAYAVHFVSVVL